ncbi:MAG: tetratricopeptide repeat protein [candidate division KSB1 bacterium]|jgi:TolA-binding protein|nr:tetratricopeptide repeat protein [candidate division KSB1 bacterium]
MKKKLIVLLFIFLSPPCIHNTPLSAALEESPGIDFEDRLQFYVDMKTKRFMQRLSTKETFLLQMIDNISEEIKDRGKNRLKADNVGFEIIYGETDQLIKEYSAEIASIIQIVEELERLEIAFSKGDNLKLLNEVDDVKDSLLVTLEKGNMQDQRFMTKQERAQMIGEYSNEVKSLLDLYDDVIQFERKARTNNDEQILDELQAQKSRIVQTLELSRISDPLTNRTVHDYISEADNIVKILRELDLLEADAEFDTSETGYNLDEIRNELIDNVDARILKLFGYTTNNAPAGPTISDFYKEWKARRVAEIQLKSTQYRVVRDELLKTGSPDERRRMVDRDMNDALLNYTDAKYDLAILQLAELSRIYKPYFENLDGALFYESEASYAAGYFESAFQGFSKLIEMYPESEFLERAFSRNLFISYTYGWYSKVFDYYEKLKLLPDASPELLDEASYLAGYQYFNQREYMNARKVLENISGDSKYYPASQYLLGIAYANMDNYSKAKLIFEELVNAENYPWTSIDYAIIRNEALLKLGYLHFQRGEYDPAIAYFDQVSEGFEKFDASIVGIAWSKMKKGDYQSTIDQISQLTSGFVLSNYTYEGMVLSAHCKELQNRTDEALENLRYVAFSKEVLNKAQNYNEERKHILLQRKELDRLEDQILDRQDERLYPKLVRVRDTINEALSSFYYRGAISSRVVEEYNDERKTLLRQIEEFEAIMTYAKEQSDDDLLKEASQQRNRLLIILESDRVDEKSSNANYFVDYPLAIREQGAIYRKELIADTFNELVKEKRRIEIDLDMITQLIASSDAETQMEVVMDLEILEDDLRDIRNRLDRFQVWVARHDIEDVQTEAQQWADFSGYGISDINFTRYYEATQKINTMAQNISHIDDILKKKKDELERRITLFDNEVMKIQKELEAEKIRLEKLEKEKYFRDIYFDRKNREIEEEEEDIDSFFDFD